MANVGLIESGEMNPWVINRIQMSRVRVCIMRRQNSASVKFPTSQLRVCPSAHSARAERAGEAAALKY